jgi:hypothetical protein
VIGGLAGRKDAEVANKPQALAELSRAFHPMPYDQMSVLLSWDSGSNVTLKNFALITPELRLTGSGLTAAEGSARLYDDRLTMEYQLRARGRQADLLRYLGVLEAQTDDLGYAACPLLIRVGGTIQNPDTSDLNARLTALAFEKSGLTDKAAELLSKLKTGK